MSSPTGLRALRFVFDALYVVSLALLTLIVSGSVVTMGAPVVIVGMYAYKLARSVAGDADWLVYVLVGSSFVALLLAPVAFLWVSRRFEQRARDREAAAVLGALESDGGSEKAKPPFLLYLRPFWSTGNFVEYSDVDMTDPFLGFSNIDFELEEQIRKGLLPFGAMVALGAPGEHFGAGRLPVEEDRWKEKILLLMKHARWIIAVPSGRPGTLWELERIFEHGVQTKTIFVMPPSAGRRKAKRDVIVRDWADAAAKSAAFGLVLPPHRPEGAVLYYRDRGGPLFTEELRLNRPRSWRQVIDRVSNA